MLEAKQTPFVLLENVDRLLKSPAAQRGRDFGIILTCFRDLGYTVEWRVINAADYGFPQRRRRTFIFACKNDTRYANTYRNPAKEILLKDGFFAKSFPVLEKETDIRSVQLPKSIGEVSEDFSFAFGNAGMMKDGKIFTINTEPNYSGVYQVLGDVMETGPVNLSYFIQEERLYYTDPTVIHSDERTDRLPKEKRQTWQYLKGAKKLCRTSKDGHKYVYSEGAMDMIDSPDKPSRTLLTSEGSFSRTTHIVRDKVTGKVRYLTPTEMERLQGFPTDWTKDSLVNGEAIPMPERKRRFLMGNALVVGLVSAMEQQLSDIFDVET